MYFLSRDESLGLNDSGLDEFLKLDDIDVISALKRWMNHQDFVLSELSQIIMKRKLL